MTGSATVTTEPSMKAMLDPRIVATSTHRPTFCVQGVGLATERITPSSQGAFTKFAISFTPSSPEETCHLHLCLPSPLSHVAYHTTSTILSTTPRKQFTVKWAKSR